MIMNLHTHTHNSPDAKQTVAERVKAANQLGLRFMAITDHVEINRYYPAEYYHAEESEMYFYDGCGVFARSAAETAAAQADCAPPVDQIIQMRSHLIDRKGFLCGRKMIPVTVIADAPGHKLRQRVDGGARVLLQCINRL